MATKKRQKVSDVKIDLIDEPKEIVRMEIDPEYIEELAQSISEIGLLQPILLAFNGDRYEIVAGHCRYLAHQKIGLTTIKSVIRDMSQTEIGLARATENIARRDLTPIEEAATYKNLIDKYGMTLEQVSQKMGKTPGTIRRRMDLIRMPPSLQKAVHHRQISMTVAEELWPIADEASLDYYLMFAIENGCTREVARQWAKDWKDSVRRSTDVSDQGGHVQTSIFEPRPTYIPCDICEQPVNLSESQYLRSCPKCMGIIKNSLKGEK
jgi:ParB/RepB/Spo0J family partition protein